MDLHDSIGNRLAQLKRSMEKERMNPLQQQHEISGIIAAVRQLSHRLTPPGVEFFSLEEQIQQLVEAARKDSKVTYEFQAVDVPDELPKDIRLQLSRIVQEGIQNIEKHSNATRAEIQLIGHPDELVLTLEDDGVGVQGEIPSGKGIGMENIRRRAVFMDALVAFTSQPGQGMQLYGNGSVEKAVSQTGLRAGAGSRVARPILRFQAPSMLQAAIAVPARPAGRLRNSIASAAVGPGISSMGT